MTEPAPPAWAEGELSNVPPAIRDLLHSGASATAVLAEFDAIRAPAIYTSIAPVSARLPFRYHAVPAWQRNALAAMIGRLQRWRQTSWAAFPRWPLDLSFDLVSDWLGAPTITFARTPVLLTHDIDSPEGLRNLLAMFLPMEEAAGARSASFIVPCAWKVDEALARQILARGHEIGTHGYDHSNRTPFALPAERDRRLAAGHAFARQFGGIGYRAPSLLRTQALLQDLAPRFRYDSSIPTSGGPYPVPNNGCASARPWCMHGVWELPLSMPRDGSLRYLGHSPAEILALWQHAALRIANAGGMVCLLTHCEARFSGNPAMLGQYQRLLEWLAADARFEFVLPATLVDRLDGRA